MAVSVRDVAAALRERMRGVSKTKLHKLLYYCQGHHLATFGVPLFRETVSAWDLGPVVGSYWRAVDDGEDQAGAADTLSQAELNTVGYVISRYGRLTAHDLINLTHAEDPWQKADVNRRPKTSNRIEHEWMRDYFSQNSADDDEIPLDSEAVSDWLTTVAEERPDRPEPRPDTEDELRARLVRA
jgi:uncharacterized phage-associated protein